MIMLADRTGEVKAENNNDQTLRKNAQVARVFGVLDTSTHLAYNALFVIDANSTVQAGKPFGRLIKIFKHGERI